jgi:hypothetical protein
MGGEEKYTAHHQPTGSLQIHVAFGCVGEDEMQSIYSKIVTSFIRFVNAFGAPVDEVHPEFKA